MEILLIGLGSIGKRHLNNILALGYTNISIVSTKDFLPHEYQHLSHYTSIEQAFLAKKITTAIICVPTAQHIQILKKCLQANVLHIYLEKPVSNNYNGIEEILTKYPTKNVFLGFDMHYDLGLQKVKQLVKSNTIGQIVSANAQVGQYLPDWRPYEDYSKGMSAKKETGGGVMLDLVHEFDYLYWLFGEAKTVASIYQNTGALNIETEDLAEVLIQFKAGIIGTIHLDYLQQKLVRNCLITGTAGTIYWDLTTNDVKWIIADKTQHVFNYKGFERNDRFVSIIRDFLNKNQTEQTTSFKQGLVSLKMVLAAKYSSENNVFVQLDKFNED